MVNNILILLGHPHIEGSKANAAMIKAASELTNVKVINVAKTPADKTLYAEAVKDADVIVFQFPTYWMTAPACLKEWEDKFMLDLMDNPGLKGKKLMVATTTGAPEEYYTEGEGHLTIAQLSAPFHGSANYCGMEYLKPFAIYGTMAPGAEERIAEGAKAYKLLLASL